MTATPPLTTHVVHAYEGTDVEPYRCSCGHVVDVAASVSPFHTLRLHLGFGADSDAAAELAKVTVPHVQARRRIHPPVKVPGDPLADLDAERTVLAAASKRASTEALEAMNAALNGPDDDELDHLGDGWEHPVEPAASLEPAAPAQPALAGVEFTATGAAITGPLDPDAVVERLRTLAHSETWTRWVAGDLFRALADDYDRTHPDEPAGAGEAAAYRLVAGLGFSQSWLNGAIAVSQRIPAANRREGLSWGHHREVAHEAIPVDEQSKWLGLAIGAGWNVAQLRNAIDEHLTADQGDLGLDDPWRAPKPPVAALKEILALDEDAWVVWHPKSGALRLMDRGGAA